MTVAIVLCSIAAYLIVGAFYARTRAVVAYQAAKREWYTSESQRISFRAQMVWRVVAWPWAILLDHVIRGALFGLYAWFSAPIDRRTERARQLRADASRWRDLRYTGTEQEREMADELARMCEERAREVDL